MLACRFKVKGPLESDFDTCLVNGDGGRSLSGRPYLGPEFFQFQTDCLAGQFVFGCRDDYFASDHVELGVDLVLEYNVDLRSGDVECPLQPFKNAHE